MVDKAIETEETEVETTEVIDGEEQPTSEVVPLESFLETKRKLTGKVGAANTETEEANRRADMLEEQVKLLTLKNQQTVTRPDREDFDSKVEYDTAADAYEDQRITAAVQKQTAQMLSDRQAQTSLQTDDANFDTNLTAHYERAGELKMADFVKVENKAIDILGPDITKFIINKIPNSEVVLANLGINPGKALQLAQKVAADPTNGAIEILRLSVDPKLDPKLKSKSITPDPEVEIGGGESGAVEQHQRAVDKARDDVTAGTANMQVIIDAKKAAKEAGVNVR